LNTLIDCFLTLMLTITAPFELSTFAHPRFHGTCMARSYGITSFMSKERRALIIQRDFTDFVIPLPLEPGHYQLQYKFREDTAWLVGKHGSQTQVIVRFGPTDMI